MNLKIAFLIALFLYFLPVNTGSGIQQIKSDEDKPNLTDTGRKIENTISLYTTGSGYENLKTATGIRTFLKAAILIINGDTLEPEGIETRGHTTLYLRRKSFSFKLKSQALFCHGERTESLKKFFALSLTMDRNYCNNRLAFEMMEASQLFDLFYSFCELRINDQSEGIYMIIERPEDWAMKKKDSPLFIRRGYDHAIDKIEADKKTGKDEIKKYRNSFRQIYSSLNKYEGEELYKVLSGYLDMETYMRWLAFNFLVRNSDYTDEVYFYIDRGVNKFRIIPWDYDDLFAPAPHEGNIENKKVLGGKLIFSAEDMLDKKIASDAFLYNLYLIQFREVLTQLSPGVLIKVFENTYAELYPYYAENEIISMSEFDVHRHTDLIGLKNGMLLLYEDITGRRDLYLNLPESKPLE